MRASIAVVACLACLVSCQRTAARPPVISSHAPVAGAGSGSAAAPVAAAPDDVDALDYRGWTALMNAAEDGDQAKIVELLGRGASLEKASTRPYEGATALVIALMFTKHDAAKLLLDRGASIAGKVGSDALLLAARDGDDAIVEELLRRGVPATSDDLALAAKYGRVHAIKRLIQAGASVNVANPNDHQFTPLMVACMENQLDAARALIDAGARVNDKDSEGVDALHWAVFAARPNEIHVYEKLSQPHDTYWVPQKDAPLVKLLIQHHAQLEAVNQTRDTALHDAAMLDAAAAAEVLVAAGANRSAKNRDGKTPLQLARDRHNSVEPVLARP